MKPEFTNVENPVHTSLETGQKIWDSRSVAVVAKFSILLQGVVHTLVVRRGPDVSDTGLWCLPCGYLDKNETCAQAARRELFEETGILLDGNTLIFDSFNDRPEDDARQNVTFHYRAMLNGNDYDMLQDFTDRLVMQPGECIDIGFKTKLEVAELEFAFGHKKRILGK